jgi:putative transcriptional regulator
LGDRLDVSRQTVIAIESGRYDPSLKLAMRIARQFGMTVEEMFDDNE